MNTETPTIPAITKNSVKGKKFSDPAVCARTVLGLTTDYAHQESFWVFCLNVRNNVVSAHMTGLGTLDKCPVHPREVFRHAIINGASKIIIAHNHPSGDPSPSQPDLDITRGLVEAGKIVGIEVLDHVVVGNPEYENAPLRFVSLREKGWM